MEMYCCNLLLGLVIYSVVLSIAGRSLAQDHGRDMRFRRRVAHCNESMFECDDVPGQKAKCFGAESLCNTRKDCDDGSDENPELCQRKKANPDGCQESKYVMVSWKDMNATFCTCPTGYQLASDNRTCLFVNPCVDSGCDHYAIIMPTPLFCFCKCAEGFDHADYHCGADTDSKSTPPVFTIRESAIQNLQNLSTYYSFHGHGLDTGKSTAIDVDLKSGDIYFNVQDGRYGQVVVRQDKVKGGNKFRTIFKKFARHMEQIFFDWGTRRNIYISACNDTSDNEPKLADMIMVCTVVSDFPFCQTVFSVAGTTDVNISAFSSFAIHPTYGFLYWVDHQLNQIVRASMDGSSATVLAVSNSSINPINIAIDYIRDFVYVLDSGNSRFTILRFDLSGRQLTFIFSNVDGLVKWDSNLGRSMLVFNHDIYITVEKHNRTGDFELLVKLDNVIGPNIGQEELNSIKPKEVKAFKQGHVVPIAISSPNAVPSSSKSNSKIVKECERLNCIHLCVIQSYIRDNYQPVRYVSRSSSFKNEGYGFNQTQKDYVKSKFDTRAVCICPYSYTEHGGGCRFDNTTNIPWAPSHGRIECKNGGSLGYNLIRGKMACQCPENKTGELCEIDELLTPVSSSSSVQPSTELHTFSHGVSVFVLFALMVVLTSLVVMGFKKVDKRHVLKKAGIVFSPVRRLLNFNDGKPDENVSIIYRENGVTLDNDDDEGRSFQNPNYPSIVTSESKIASPEPVNQLVNPTSQVLF